MFKFQTPPPVVAEATVARSAIISDWKSRKDHGPTEHAIYAIARLDHSIRKRNADEEVIDRTAARDMLLKRLVHTFGPVTKPSKVNAGVKPFGALFSALDRAREKPQNWWGGKLTDEEVARIREVADDLFKEARARGRQELAAYAVVAPARVKKPYTGPKTGGNA